MNKFLAIFFFVIISMANHCAAQNIPVDAKPARVKNKPSDRPKAAVKNKQVVSSPKPPAPSPVFNGIVNIIADENCTIQINNLSVIGFKRGETKTFRLENGSYKLIATSPPSYLYDTEFIVKSDTSVVRILLTAVIAEAQRKEVQRKSDSLAKIKTDAALEKARADSARVINTANSTAAKTKDPAIEAMNKLKARQKATVDTMLSNMVAVGAGSFVMGKNLRDNDEGPEHTVVIRTFQFGKYEVTQRQWETIMGTNPSVKTGCGDCPVENIAFYQIDSFLYKINQISSKKFRLPTEAEWEYVARKGADNKDLKEKAWYSGNAENTTHAVGMLLPNSLGIYDMSGNVAEWCSDWYSISYYQKKISDNPTGPGDGDRKVVRGGAYNNSKGTLRLTYRDKQDVALVNAAIGLRLAMEVK